MGPLFFVFMKENIRKKILELAAPIIEAAGLEIWGLELVGDPPRSARLFVELPLPLREGKDVSASIDQCEDISRKLGLTLEVEDCMPGPWTLEISSPGLERKFFRLEQMRPYVGDLLEATLAAPLASASTDRKIWRGRLREVGENEFVLEPCQITAEGEILPEKAAPCSIPFAQCKKARRLHVFQTPQKPGKGRSKAACRT